MADVIGAAACPAGSGIGGGAASPPDPDLSNNHAEATTTVIAVAIPTLSEWGMIALVGLLVGFGFLVFYRRQALKKMDAAVDRADDALQKYEEIYKEMKRVKGRSDGSIDDLRQRMDEARQFRDDLAEKRDKLKRFF